MNVIENSSVDEKTILYTEMRLKDIIPKNSEESLFNKRTKIERKVGTITNIKRKALNQLLDMFEPFDQGSRKQYNIKKAIVANAIQALYNPYNPHHPQDIKNNRSSLINPQHSNSFYKTPQRPQIKNNSLSLTKFTKTEDEHHKQRFTASLKKPQKTKCQFSFQKLNYESNQNKYSKEEVMKLKLRSGCLDKKL